jgi:hypothetical protein
MTGVEDMVQAGYSGKPLSSKLGWREGAKILAIDAPDDYAALLGELPDGAQIVSKTAKPYASVHLFAASRTALGKHLQRLRQDMAQYGMLWVSWPKKTSGVASDLSDNVIRELALPLGFVDIKVCAVSEIWSGLKLVIRKSERQ